MTTHFEARLAELQPRDQPTSFTLPTPIRDGVVYVAGLPADLTEEEADRIARVIRAFAMSSHSSLPIKEKT